MSIIISQMCIVTFFSFFFLFIYIVKLHNFIVDFVHFKTRHFSFPFSHKMYNNKNTVTDYFGMNVSVCWD